MSLLQCSGKSSCGEMKPLSQFIEVVDSRIKNYKWCKDCREARTIKRVNAEAQGRNLKQERLRDQAVDAAIKAIEKQTAKLIELKGEEYAVTLLRVTADAITLGR